MIPIDSLLSFYVVNIVADDQSRFITGKSERLPGDAVFPSSNCSDSQDLGATFERFKRENLVNSYHAGL